MSQSKKNIKVRDIKPKKDAKGGGPKSTLPVTNPQGSGGSGGGGGSKMPPPPIGPS